MFYSNFCIRTKLPKLASKKFSGISVTKRGEPIFQVWSGEKKWGNQNFFKILGGTNALHTMVIKDLGNPQKSDVPGSARGEGAEQFDRRIIESAEARRCRISFVEDSARYKFLFAT